MIRAAIIDYAGTMRKPGTMELYPEVLEALEALSTLNVRTALVSVAGSQTLKQRETEIRTLGLYEKFEIVWVTDVSSEKAALCDQVLDSFELSASEVAVVDDRYDRGIQWGNQRGALTIAMKRDEAPRAGQESTSETGTAQHVINGLDEFVALVRQSIKEE